MKCEDSVGLSYTEWKEIECHNLSKNVKKREKRSIFLKMNICL